MSDFDRNEENVDETDVIDLSALETAVNAEPKEEVSEEQEVIEEISEDDDIASFVRSTADDTLSVSEPNPEPEPEPEPVPEKEEPKEVPSHPSVYEHEEVSAPVHTETVVESPAPKKHGVIYWIIVVVGTVFIMVTSYGIGLKVGKIAANEVVPEKEEKKETAVSEDVLKEVKQIVGINKDGEYDTQLQYLLLNVNGGVNKQLTDVNQSLLVYYYAANHDMLKTIDASTYSLCAAGSGVCQAISTDDYAEIAKKFGISQAPTTVFDAAHIYEEQYLYTNVVNNIDATYDHSNVEAYHVGDDIALVETLTIKSGAGAELKQTVTYLFKGDVDDHYSLYSIARA